MKFNEPQFNYLHPKIPTVNVEENKIILKIL